MPNAIQSSVNYAHGLGAPLTNHYYPGIRRLIDRIGKDILSTLPYPFLYGANLLVVLYWLEVLTEKRVSAFPHLKRLRSIFIGFAVYLLLAEILVDVLRVYFSMWPVVLTIVNYIISILSISISVIIVLVRINKRRKKEGIKMNTQLTRMNRLMIAMACLCFTILIYLGVYLPFIYDPYGSNFGHGLLAILACVLTGLQTSMFRPRSSSRGSSSDKSQLTSAGSDSGATKGSRDSSPQEKEKEKAMSSRSSTEESAKDSSSSESSSVTTPSTSTS